MNFVSDTWNIISSVSTHKALFQVPKNQHTFAEKFSWYGAKVVGVEMSLKSSVQILVRKKAVEFNTGSRVQCGSEAQRY
jgi:hypothetical protein